VEEHVIWYFRFKASPQQYSDSTFTGFLVLLSLNIRVQGTMVPDILLGEICLTYQRVSELHLSVCMSVRPSPCGHLRYLWPKIRPLIFRKT